MAFHHHPGHDTCVHCAEWPAWARALMFGLAEMETTMTQSNQDLQAHVDADVAALKDAFTTAINELKQQIANAPSQPAGTLDFTGLDNLVAAVQAEAAADAPAPAPTGSSDPVSTTPADAGSTTAQQPTPSDAPVPTLPAAGDTAPANAGELAPPAPTLPLYKHEGAGAIDPAAWPLSGLKATDDGALLYTFTGDTAGEAPTGASDEWLPYSGDTATA